MVQPRKGVIMIADEKGSKNLKTAFLFFQSNRRIQHSSQVGNNFNSIAMEFNSPVDVVGWGTKASIIFIFFGCLNKYIQKISRWIQKGKTGNRPALNAELNLIGMAEH